MTPEIIRELVPFGIVGLAIVAIVVIVMRPQSGTNRTIIVIAIAVIAAMAMFDRWIQWSQRQPIKTVQESGIVTTGGVSPAQISFRVLSSPGLPGLKAAESWINDTCRPNQIADVTSFLSQLGRGAPYNIFIFCRHGNGRTRVAARERIFEQGSLDPNALVVEMQARPEPISIIGLYAGERNAIFYFQAQRPDVGG